jgi:hypothetical protein
MSITIEESGSLSALIQQVGARAVRGVYAQMKVEAEKVAQKAREFAPVDEGNLEQAIKVREAGGGRNELGQFERKSVEVYVDAQMPVPERPGKTVGDYAYEMHEHLTPAGPLQLGPKSEAKNAGSGQVGGKYMERAADAVAAEILNSLTDAAIKAVG